MRIIFFPGFAENHEVLKPLIDLYAASNETVCIDYRPILDKLSDSQPDLAEFTDRIAFEYKITEDDLLIGHSFGGWIAAHIHQVILCPTVILGSFTDTQHIKRRWITFHPFTQYLTKKGILKSRIFHAIVRRKYRKRASAPAIEACLGVMRDWKDIYFHQIAMLLKGQKPLPYLMSPLLRIHGLEDDVITTPSVFYHRIEEGDHHIQFTHPQKIKQFIETWQARGYEVEVIIDKTKIKRLWQW